MVEGASEVPVLAMILEGGESLAANREACLETGHGGIILLRVELVLQNPNVCDEGERLPPLQNHRKHRHL